MQAADGAVTPVVERDELDQLKGLKQSIPISKSVLHRISREVANGRNSVACCGSLSKVGTLPLLFRTPFNLVLF